MRKIIVAAVVACALGAYAEERTVSTAQELFEAIQALNGTGGTIYLETGNYDVGAYDYGGYWKNTTTFVTTNGFCHLALNNLTLIGKSDNPRDTVIYGNRTKCVVRSSVGTMHNLTVSNGCTALYNVAGGGVGATGRTSIFSNMVVTCCSTVNSSKGNGGGVDSGTWYDSTIISNFTTKAGGGVSGGTLYNCTVISNYAKGTAGGCYYGSRLHDCRVLYNTAEGTGGGIATASSAEATPCYVYGGLIAGNVSKSGGGGAGNENIFYGGTVVSNNTANGDGGGIYLGNAAKHGIVSNAVICCNTAKGSGGGCSGSGIVVGCEIFGNTAATGGGCSSGSYTACTITNNLATGAQGGGCNGGVYTNCLIACNSLLSTSTKTVYAGGLYNGVAVGCTIVSNTVGTLSSNSSSAAYGGGASGSHIFDSFVGYNQTTGGVQAAYGGGLYYGTASNCLIVGNAAWGAKERQGGGANGTALTNCIVRNNVASLGTGLNYGSAYGCLFSNNVSQTAASATMLRRPGWLENCEVVGTCMMACWAKNCRFVNYTNGAFIAEGENVHFSGYSPGSDNPTLFSSGLSLTNCLVANNTCGNGGLFACSATKGIDLVNCTIADNELSATFYYTTNGIPGVIENCIFVGNKTKSGAARNLAYAQSATNLWISNCLIGSGRSSYAPVFEANTITNDNAGFVGGDGPDRYALRYGSRARGKGLVQDWMTDALDVRQDPAFPRLRDGAVDIGCYQCWLDPIGFTFSVR